MIILNNIIYVPIQKKIILKKIKKLSNISNNNKCFK